MHDHLRGPRDDGRVVTDSSRFALELAGGEPGPG